MVFLVYFVSRSVMINFLILPVLLMDVNLEISISGSCIPSFENTLMHSSICWDLVPMSTCKFSDYYCLMLVVCGKA